MNLLILQKFASEVFNGNNYPHWAVCMETYLKALGLWDGLVEEIHNRLPENPTMKELKAWIERIEDKEV